MHVIVQQPYFFAGLEGWETNVGTTVAAKCVAECAVATASNLALDGEINFCELIGIELHSIQRLVGVVSFGLVLCFNLFLQTTSTILAGSSTFSGLGSALRG